jgi:beta-N-acetylhexosaminidase
MYDRLNELEKNSVDAFFDGLSLDERIAQVFNVNMFRKTPEEAAELFAKYPFGAAFFAYSKAEDTAAVMRNIQETSSVPVLGSADLVNGAGSRIEGCTLFPWQMAVGAADSEELAEKMGLATAIEGRHAALHWTFGPIVDLSINKDNSMMHTRTFGDDPDHVIRMGRAFIRGVQTEKRMAATVKHFPGDGVDDRDSHVCTSINSLSRDEWYESFGKVWQSLLREAACVMSGHIALPWIDPGRSYLGPAPATLSSPIQIELLRNQLGFGGVVVSDAIPMVGFSGFAPYRNRIAGNIESGSDMILWPDPVQDIDEMKSALDEGLLTEERLNQAVKNILALKVWLGLIQTDGSAAEPAGSDKTAVSCGSDDFQQWADEIGERAVCIVRNENTLLPLALPKGSKVATVTLTIGEDTRGYVKELDVVDQELKDRGFEVEHFANPGPELLNARGQEFNAVFINVHVMPVYGTTRMVGTAVRSLWNSFWHGHPAVVFTSFGDPYKLYEMPYVPNYVLTFSNTPSSQRAVVKVWLGELKAQGRLPVSLDGYFERQVTGQPDI